MRLQVVAARALDRQHARADRRDARRAGIGICRWPARYWPVSECGASADLLRRALRDDLPAVLAGAGPHVDDVVGGRDRVVVVLDDDHAVAEIAQVLQRREQPVVVALVQADRRLVQHVHHAGQPGADLRREPDALRLAAGERLRRAVERQVVEADVVEEREPAHDLLDDPVGDRLLLAVERQPAKKRGRLLQRQCRHLEDRARASPVADLDVARLAPQPRAVALGAGLRVEVLRELLAHHHRIGLAVAPLEVRDDALERVLAHHRLAALGQVRERNLLVAAAVEDDLLHALGQLRERPLEVEADVLREAPQHLEVELVAPVPALDRAGGERELRKRDDALRIEEADRAEAVAARARAHRIVEREEPRLELGQRVVADRARELRREQVLALPVSISTAIARPSPWRSAVSYDSARRCFRSARTRSRSTTTSIVCLVFFASFGTASISYTLPSTRTRTKPLARSSTKSSSCSPLRLTTTGARIISFVSSGNASVASTICEIVIAASFCSG